MNTIFSPDSKVMQLLNRAADLLILNLLFILTSIPLVTIGPSLAALYHVIFAMDSDRETGIFSGYFRGFRDNFRQSLALWLLLLAVAAALVLDWNLAVNFEISVWVRSILGILFVLELLTSAVLFPLLSLFRNSATLTLKNALILSLANLPRTACAAALWLLPVLLVIEEPTMFPTCAFAGLTFYASAAAYGTAYLLQKVFRQYLPEDLLHKEETK